MASKRATKAEKSVAVMVREVLEQDPGLPAADVAALVGCKLSEVEAVLSEAAEAAAATSKASPAPEAPEAAPSDPSPAPPAKKEAKRVRYFLQERSGVSRQLEVLAESEAVVVLREPQ